MTAKLEKRRDKILHWVTIYLTTEEEQTRQNAAKNLIALLWNDTTFAHRRSMLNRIDETDDHIMYLEPWPAIRLVKWWDYVVRYGFTGWDGEFVASIDAKRKARKNWRPTKTEEKHIRRLWGEVEANAVRTPNEEVEQDQIAEEGAD